MSESFEHKTLKMLMAEKLKDWFGVSTTEYNKDGNRIDVYCVTSKGVKIYIEIIWHHSMSHFNKDIISFLTTRSDIKIIIASPDILNDNKMNTEYRKKAIFQAENGVTVYYDMINGAKLIGDKTYVDNEFKEIMTTLHKKALDKFVLKREELKNIYNLLSRELQENLKKLTGLFASGQTSYMDRLTSMSAWNLYKQKLVEYNSELIGDLINIYDKLENLNEVIKNSEGTVNYSIARFKNHRRVAFGISENIKKLIENIEIRLLEFLS